MRTKRNQIIDQVKSSNGTFFSRDNKSFFGDSKYRWITREKQLIITCRVRAMHGYHDAYDRQVIYSWDNPEFRLRAL